MKERIEKILRDKKLSQAEFADRIGVNRSSITHLMTGRNKSSETVLARTLLEFSDINPQWLSEGKGEMYRSVKNSPTLFDNIVENDENSESEEENILAHFNPYPVEEKAKTPQISQPVPSSELRNQPAVNNEPTILPPQQNVEKENKLPKPCEKQIRKIVFFYDDKTFEEYYPEKTE